MTTTQPRPGAPRHRRPNHYSRDEFFGFVPAEGAVFDWNDRRNLLVSEDFIVALQRGLEQEAGPASTVLMYELGRRWGTSDFDHFGGWFAREFDTTVEEAPLKLMLETWWWPFAAQGWGKWELEDPERGYLVVNLFDSAVAKTLGNVGKPVCHLYAGLFAGFFSQVFKELLSGVEIQCYGMGESYCKFMVGKQDRTDAVEFWLSNGATAKEITRRLEQGETP
jgi:predicted hydrocarbon binding protein